LTRARDVASILTAATALATDAETAAAISSHNSATTSVHGISNTATLATQTYADSAVSTHAAAADPHSVYLKESEFNAAGKNVVINGAFDIWQRGTSGTFTNGVGHVPDRWFGIVSGGAPTCTISRQTADTTNLTYGARFGRNSGQTGVGTVYFVQTFESIMSKSLAGQTVTISFYAKKGNDAPSPLYAGFYFGTGTDQSSNTLFNGGGWTNTTQSNTGVTITNTMTRYTVTVNVSSSINQAMLYFAYTSSGTAGANEWIQIEGVQLELGSVATPFSRAGGTIQGELAACQRYYFRFGGDNVYQRFGQGQFTTTTNASIVVVPPVTMRVNPTSVDSSTLATYDATGGIIAATAVTNPSESTKSLPMASVTIASGGVAARPCFLLANNSTSAFLGFSAEL